MHFDINTQLLKDGSVVVFYNQSPLIGIKSFDGFIDDVSGVTGNTKITREFSLSYDNINWRPYTPLTNANISTIQSSDNLYFFRFRYTRSGTSDTDIIEIKTFDLQYKLINPKIPCAVKPTVSHTEDNSLCDMIYPDIDVNNGILCNPDFTFDPYASTRNFNMQQQLNMFINQNLGIEVRYFRTLPDIKTADSFLNEYSLKGVVESKCIKISLIDNELPSNKPKYDEWGLGFDTFEIHIDHGYFQKMFGAGINPRNEDYIHLIPANKLYYIHSNYLEQGLNGKPNYWVISLKKYDDDMSMIKSPEVQKYISDISITGKELFGEKEETEMKDMLNINQSTKPTTAKDDIREYIDEDVLIMPYELSNNGSVISDYHYDFTSMDKNLVAIRYKSKLNICDNKFLSINAWFNLIEPEETDLLLFHITKITKLDRYHYSCEIDVDTKSLMLNKYDYIISDTKSNAYQVLDITNDKTITILSQSIPLDNVEYNVCVKNTLFKSIKDNMGIRIDLLDSSILMININKKYFRLNLKNALEFEKWYGFIFSLDVTFGNIAYYIYQMEDRLEDEDRFSTRLTSVSKEAMQFNPEISIGGTSNNIELISSKIKMTNIRMWNIIIPEDSHSIILNTKIIKNASKALLIDNAMQNLNIPKMGSEI